MSNEPQIRRLEQHNASEIKLACIADDGYVDTVGGTKYRFRAGDIVLVEQKFGDFLAKRARKAWEMQKRQRVIERREWSKRVSSTSQVVKDQAVLYCDKNGKPYTDPPPWPQLVNLDTDDGRKWYEQWLSQQPKGEEADTVVPIKAPEPQGQADDDPGSIVDYATEGPEMPNPGWTKEEKLEYIRRHADKTGLKPWGGLIARDDMAATLEKRVQETYDILKEQFEGG